MSSLIRWERPRGAVHNVQAALDYGDAGCNVLVVSDATLYVLQNLVGLDVEFKARWADEVLENGYKPITEESANYGPWVDLIARIQAEVSDVSCDIIAALASLQSAIVDQSLEIRLIKDGVRDQQLCCGPVADLPYSEADPSGTENPLTSTFCDRSWSYARDWGDVAKDVLEAWLALVTVGVGTLATITLILTLPLGILLGIVALIASAILQVTKDDILAVIDDLVPLVACDVYSSFTAASAKVAIDATLDAFDYPITWTVVATQVLKSLVGYDALNKVYDETYTIRTDSINSDCISCYGEEWLVLTSYYSPYNAIFIGDAPPRLDGFSDDAAYGWEVHYGSSEANRLAIGFTPTINVTTLNLKYQIYGVSGSGLTTVLISTYGGGQQIESEQWDDLSVNGVWVDVVHEFACVLSANTHYEILFATEFDQNARFRYIRLQAVLA